jgi:hypothetical protein
MPFHTVFVSVISLHGFSKKLFFLAMCRPFLIALQVLILEI